MTNKAFNITIEELSKKGKNDIPDHFVPACHLIYSSPATLVYNSPGAIGFGVKRAGLVIPESVMLLVSPDCCARNSTVLSATEGYAERMFYLMMSESDLVTGKHLVKIPEAIKEILEVAEPAPKVVVICITCVDALLGTDLERICRKAQEECGVIVVPSYMYALEREGKRPPMTQIRQTIYSLIDRKKVMSNMINIMGFFTPLDEESELFNLLKSAGIKKINQVSAMKSLDEYYEMGAANFNLVLDPESRFAAEELKDRLGMPYVELARLYDPERIHRQYQYFAAGIGVKMDDAEIYEEALSKRDDFAKRYKGKTFAVGEMANANPFELALSLICMGMSVKYIYSNVTENDFIYIDKLAEVSPDTRVFTGISPSMINYEGTFDVDISIGKDAGSYCRGSVNVPWMSEEQPFGFRGFIKLIDAIDESVIDMRGENNERII